MTQATSNAPDLTAAELAFRFSSGRPGLAFVMTVGERGVRSYERLRQPADLARWVVASGLLDRKPRVTARGLEDARVLRESMYGLVRAILDNRSFDQVDLDIVNSWARLPDLAPQLGEGGALACQVGRSQLKACLASVARDMVRMLGEEDLSRLRECEGQGCGILFFDRSRPGNRRWCADGVCGSRTRVAAYRSRS
jgi:predicted RNA-binding Zn ribbon-like protein